MTPQTSLPTDNLANEAPLKERPIRGSYWVPLMIFGALVSAAGPLLVRDYYAQPPTTRSVFTGDSVGLYWQLTLVTGAVATAAWYTRLRRVIGVTTPIMTTLLTWLVGGLVLTLPPVSYYAEYLPSQLWVPLAAKGELLVIAAGFLVLAYQLRSRLLAATAVTYTAVAALSVYYNVENLLPRLLTGLGFDISRAADLMATGPSLAATLPGVVLLTGGAAAWVQSLRGGANPR